jgi:hypothetical protein
VSSAAQENAGVYAWLDPFLSSDFNAPIPLLVPPEPLLGTDLECPPASSKRQKAEHNKPTAIKAEHNRTFARDSRQRKKKYVESLESQVYGTLAICIG